MVLVSCSWPPLDIAVKRFWTFCRLNTLQWNCDHYLSSLIITLSSRQEVRKVESYRSRV